MEAYNLNPQIDLGQIKALIEENKILRQEIRVAREAARITANLTVKQFEETDKILRRFQTANAQRKAVLDSASQISIIATNIEGMIIVFNTGAENLLGYRAHEIIGNKTPEIFHDPKELEIVSKQLTRHIGKEIKGLSVFFEYGLVSRGERSEWTYIRKDGSYFPVNLSVNILREPDGTIGGFLCIARDITEKKKSEEALRQSEQKYRLLINNLPNIVYKGYADGAIDFFDEKIEILTGYSREDFLKRKVNWYDLILEDDLEQAKAEFKAALKTNKSYIREYRLRNRSGQIHWIEETSQIICDEAGHIDFITGAFLDITKRKQAEKALHESEEQYRSLFNSGPNPIFLIDSQTMEILDANPRVEETYQYKKEELIGRCFTELGTTEAEDKGIAQLKYGQFDDKNVKSQKVRQYKKDKTPFFINFNACPIRYKDRDTIILAATDITEMLEKDAILIQAAKMKTLGELSAGIAHELNQPLNAIKMGNEFLKLMIEDGKKIPEDQLVAVAKEVSHQVDRAAQIINQLRNFGRKPDLAKENVDPNLPIRNVLGIIGKQLRLSAIKVILDLEESLPPISAHCNRLEQVVFNLITNARDAINQKRELSNECFNAEIKIRTFMKDHLVHVAIYDNGIGISKETQEKIFEPFFTTKEVGKGMGLGLYIIYRIIRDDGGDISIKSNEGMGTCASYSFPPILSE